MRGLALIIAVMSVANIASADTQNDDNKDHLVLVDLQRFPKYREILISKIGVTPFDYGRVTIRPSFDPEFSVSVYAQYAENGERVYRVTYIMAAVNLWQRTDIGRYPEEATSVKMYRIDADIPQTTAELIQQVWLRMLQDAHGHVPPPVSEQEVIPGDTTDFEWSLDRANAPPLYGEVNQYLAAQGDKVKALLNLSETLLKYSKAKPAERPPIASEIERKARRLLASFDERK